MTTLDMLHTMTPTELRTLINGLRPRRNVSDLRQIFDRAVIELRRKTK